MGTAVTVTVELAMEGSAWISTRSVKFMAFNPVAYTPKLTQHVNTNTFECNMRSSFSEVLRRSFTCNQPRKEGAGGEAGDFQR